MIKITKQGLIKNIPNLVTSLRFVGTAGLLLLTPLSRAFFVVYTLTGVTDVLDGYLSRKMNLVSAFGSRLDSAADLFFYTVSLVKLLPVLVANLPARIWLFVAVVLAVRAASYTVAAVKFRRFASNHTVLNKITGVFVFAVPYFWLTKLRVGFCMAVCAVGFLSSLEELFLHLASSDQDASAGSNGRFFGFGKPRGARKPEDGVGRLP